MSGAAVLLIVLIALVVVPLPMYIVGSKRGVSYPWVAFIPVVGYTIVWLWSMDRSGWMTLISFVPIANLVFALWLAFGMPPHHGRTRWWGVALILLPWIGPLIYALTLDDVAGTAVAPA